MSFERWESLLRDYKAAKATAKGHGEGLRTFRAPAPALPPTNIRKRLNMAKMKRREKITMVMSSREARRHPERAEQIRVGGNNVNGAYLRALLAVDNPQRRTARARYT